MVTPYVLGDHKYYILCHGSGWIGIWKRLPDDGTCTAPGFFPGFLLLGLTLAAIVKAKLVLEQVKQVRKISFKAISV